MNGTYRQMRRRLRQALVVVPAATILSACGGSPDQAKPPASTTTVAQGGVVRADGTHGLVGPAQRATPAKTEVTGRRGAIPPDAHRPTDAQRHGVAAGAACGDSALLPDAGNIGQIEASILCLLNAERADAGLPALTRNAQLDAASIGMSRRMVAERFFAHDTPDGIGLVERVRPTGYLPRADKWVLGENLAWGSGGLSSPQAIVNGWMNSPGHKANVLAPDYRDIGIGVVLGAPTPSGTGGATYTTDFGARPSGDVAGTSASGTTGSGTTARVSVPGSVATSMTRALRSGVSYSARCARACTLVGRLYLSARGARSARLSSRRVAVGSGRVRLRAGSRGRLTVRMTRRARRALRNRRPLRLTLVTTDRSTRARRSTRVTLR